MKKFLDRVKLYYIVAKAAEVTLGIIKNFADFIGL